MFSLFYGLYQWAVKTSEVFILIVGLDGAGKTSCANAFKEIVEATGNTAMKKTVPTIGFNVVKIKYEGNVAVLWDLGGQGMLRGLWSHYYKETSAVVYVIDCTDIDRADEAKNELRKLLRHPDLSDDTPLLILDNKIDIQGPQVDINSLMAELLASGDFMDRDWKIQKTSAMTNQGILEGLRWIFRSVAKPS